MNICTIRILDRRELTEGDTMSLDESIDLGSFHTFDLVIYVHTPAEGEAPTLTLTHAAFNEEGTFVALDPAVEVDLSVEGSTWIRVEAYTRYLRWSLGGRLGTSAVVTLDLVARG